MSDSTEKLASIYYPLRLTYGLVPIVAGADKFFNILTNWEKYLPPAVVSATPLSPEKLMSIVGLIEIVAGVAVLTALTRLGSYVVMAWLVLIAGNLVLSGYLDIAVRDLVMALGAYTLGQVAGLRGDSWLPKAGISQGTPTHAAAR